MNRMCIVTIALLALFSIELSHAEDSWVVDGIPEPVETYTLPPSESILKWCEEGGKKVRYAQNPVPGYRLCGEIEALKLCDPSGRRFISTAQGAPYTYRDCTVGKRIEVIRHDPLPEFTPQAILDPAPMSDAERLEAHKKIDEIRQNEAGDLARELQGLTTDLSEAIRTMRRGVGGKVD